MRGQRMERSVNVQNVREHLNSQRMTQAILVNPGGAISVNGNSLRKTWIIGALSLPINSSSGQR